MNKNLIIVLVVIVIAIGGFLGYQRIPKSDYDYVRIDGTTYTISSYYYVGSSLVFVTYDTTYKVNKNNALLFKSNN